MDGNENLVETDGLSSCYFHRHSTAAAVAAVADDLVQTNWQPMMNSVCLEILRSHHLILDETHSFRHPLGSSSKILCCCYAAAAAADGSLEIEPRHRRSQPPPPQPLLPPLERYRVGLIHEPRSPPENQIRHASERPIILRLLITWSMDLLAVNLEINDKQVHPAAINNKESVRCGVRWWLPSTKPTAHITVRCGKTLIIEFARLIMSLRLIHQSSHHLNSIKIWWWSNEEGKEGTEGRESEAK